MDYRKHGFNGLLGALAVSLLLAAAASPTATAQPPAMERPRMVIVSGSGEVATLPDRARLSLSVFVVDPELVQAETEVNAAVRRYVEEARKLGAKDAEISTASLRVQPEYVWDEQLRSQKLTGYRVSRDIRILVTDLERIGDFLLRATAAGVNEIQPPVLESSRAADLHREALAKAADDARANARVLAETLDAKLGPVRSIQAAELSHPPPQPFKVMAMRADAASSASGNEEMGFETGEIVFTATLQAEFDLLLP